MACSVLLRVGYSVFPGLFSDKKGEMDLTVDCLQNAPLETCDEPHGPSFADDVFRLETSNLYGESMNESPISR